MSIENEILFGRAAVKGGYVNQKQLADAIKTQKECLKTGQTITLGEIFIHQNLMTDKHVDRVLRSQGKDVENLIVGYKILKKLRKWAKTAENTFEKNGIGNIWLKN